MFSPVLHFVLQTSPQIAAEDANLPLQDFAFPSPFNLLYFSAFLYRLYFPAFPCSERIRDPSAFLVVAEGLHTCGRREQEENKGRTRLRKENKG